MDITTSIYQVDDVPEGVRRYLKESIDHINDQLNLGDYLSEVRSVEAILEDYDDYPFQQQLTEFLVDLLGDELNERYKELITDPDDDFLEKLVRIRNIIAEQDIYLDEKETNCDIYMITAHVDNDFYGLIYCFYNKKYPNYLMIQGISKTLKYMLSDLLYPKMYSKLPKLNSILMPSIESLAKQIGATKIIVAPIGNQGNILNKHYGFNKVKEIKYPCMLILGSDSYDIDYYEKEIP